jgi:hypothetical protein
MQAFEWQRGIRRATHSLKGESVSHNVIHLSTKLMKQQKNQGIPDHEGHEYTPWGGGFATSDYCTELSSGISPQRVSTTSLLERRILALGTRGKLDAFRSD